jgi:transposase
MRFEEVFGRYRCGRLSCEEAANVLGISVSSFFRWRQRYEADGSKGLADQRIGKASARRAPVDEVARVPACCTDAQDCHRENPTKTAC